MAIRSSGVIGIQCFGQSSVMQKSVTTPRECYWSSKGSIAGYGYSEDLFAEAEIGIKVVVKAHLNCLQKWNKLSDERLHEVRRFADVVSTAAKTFKRLRYAADLHAANNLNMVVEKLFPSLCVKWKEYKRDKGLTF